MLKKMIRLLACLGVMTTLGTTHLVGHASEVKKIDDLPFQGYFIGPEDSAIQGLLFEDNQIWLYIKPEADPVTSGHGHEHGHDEGASLESDEDSAHVEEHAHEDESHFIDMPFIEELFEFASFPYPDLKNYTANVRARYYEELNMPADLQKAYLDLAEEITPDMSQEDVFHLINSKIPGILYTEKFGYQYFILASPSVVQSSEGWEIHLLGHKVFELKQEGNHLVDQKGRVFEYIDGIKPH